MKKSTKIVFSALLPLLLSLIILMITALAGNNSSTGEEQNLEIILCAISLVGLIILRYKFISPDEELPCFFAYFISAAVFGLWVLPNVIHSVVMDDGFSSVYAMAGYQFILLLKNAVFLIVWVIMSCVRAFKDYIQRQK